MTESTLQFADWCVIGGFAMVVVGIGLYFTRRGSSNIDSFFLSGRALPWYISGISMIATSFASDTPLWITNLIRQYGVHYIWQYWAPAIGGALGMVLFSRLMRRSNIITDVELFELRYHGRTAAILRGASGFIGAVILCPLICAWVTKAMAIISSEALAVAPEDMKYVTIIIVALAVIACSASGLWGVAYTDLFQFFVATAGTILLAALSVKEVGGLSEMVNKLSAMKDWTGHNLSIAPSIGTADHQMSIWNAIGYFLIIWWGGSLCSAYCAQRILACKDVRHSSFAMLLNNIVYFGLIAWPWIIVGLCSIILLPDLGQNSLGKNITGDHAYPRMIMTILPVGLRGLLVASMLAAFVSTMSTLFNWGASYLVNDVYKRFLKPDASGHHYVWISRLATVLLAVEGGILSHQADRIQDLLAVFYIAATGTMVPGILRWLWWRLNATAELVSLIVTWLLTIGLMLCRICDDSIKEALGGSAAFLLEDYYLGARMLAATVIIVVVTVSVSLLTKPADTERLQVFIKKVRPLSFGWKPVIRLMPEPYVPAESIGRTIVSWMIALICTFSILLGIGQLLLGRTYMGLFYCVIFIITLILIVQRIQRDFESSDLQSESDSI